MRIAALIVAGMLTLLVVLARLSPPELPLYQSSTSSPHVPHHIRDYARDEQAAAIRDIFHEPADDLSSRQP